MFAGDFGLVRLKSNSMDADDSEKIWKDVDGISVYGQEETVSEAQVRNNEKGNSTGGELTDIS